MCALMLLQLGLACTNAIWFFLFTWKSPVDEGIEKLREAEEDKEEESSFERQETSQEEMKGGARKKERPHVHQSQPP